MIKILTYNTFLRPPPVKNNDNDYKNERCDLIIKQFNQFDIICLQEVFGFLNMRKLKIIDKAIKKGFEFAESPSPSFFSGSLIDGGLLTLSKFPIQYSEFKAFPYGILSDNLSMKGILYTKINIKDQILHLFNAHLQASYIGNEQNIIATIKTRIDQLKCYREFISKFSYSSKDLILLAGDFNVDARQKNIIKELGLSEYESMIRILGQQQNITNCLPEYPITYADPESNETCLTAKEDQGTAQSLDYFFRIDSQESSLKIKSARVEPFRIEGHPFTQLSDHYGVICELNIK